MELSYAAIPIASNKFAKLNREQRMFFNVDVPNRESEGMVCFESRDRSWHL
jgi:hypothetical protein